MKKTIKKVILFPIKLIQTIVVEVMSVVAIIILAAGILLLGISYFIKSPKDFKESVKKIIQNETK